MSLGLQYKNQEHIFDEKTVNSRWGSVSELSNVRRNGNRASWIFYKTRRCQQGMLGNYEHQHNKRR